MNYNPYDLVAVKINSKPSWARPIEWDSEPVNNNSVKNKQGGWVKPLKLAATCHDCGAGLEMAVFFPDPPFPVQEIQCKHCKLVVPPLPDPFQNPIESGRVAVDEAIQELPKPEEALASQAVLDYFLTSNATAKRQVLDVCKRLDDAIGGGPADALASHLAMVLGLPDDYPDLMAGCRQLIVFLKAKWAELGPKLRSKRMRKKLTQADVAQQTALSVAEVSLLERGKTIPSGGMLGKVADVISLDLAALDDDLFG